LTARACFRARCIVDPGRALPQARTHRSDRLRRHAVTAGTIIVSTLNVILVLQSW
jgi:hypothetical protein